jgi:serine/threonine-protein kinase
MSGRPLRAAGVRYHVSDSDSGQIVAVTVLHASLSSDINYIERFGRQASLASSIDHPNIVEILQVGQGGDEYFMALGLLLESLAGIIEGVGQLGIEGGTQYGVPVAYGLAEARALGIVYRRLKPRSIVIGREGTARTTGPRIARAESLAR